MSSPNRLFAPVHDDPLLTARALSLPFTCEDEHRRAAMDGRSAFAKVGVAGSNPVVRSRSEVALALPSTSVGHSLGHGPPVGLTHSVI
jgi:hypothetical protein